MSVDPELDGNAIGLVGQKYFYEALDKVRELKSRVEKWLALFSGSTFLWHLGAALCRPGQAQNRDMYTPSSARSKV